MAKRGHPLGRFEYCVLPCVKAYCLRHFDDRGIERHAPRRSGSADESAGPFSSADGQHRSDPHCRGWGGQVIAMAYVLGAVGLVVILAGIVAYRRGSERRLAGVRHRRRHRRRGHGGDRGSTRLGLAGVAVRRVGPCDSSQGRVRPRGRRDVLPVACGRSGPRGVPGCGVATVILILVSVWSAAADHVPQLGLCRLDHAAAAADGELKRGVRARGTGVAGRHSPCAVIRPNVETLTMC